MSNLISNKTRYDAIDGLRAYSSIGIVLMHVLTNGNYALSGFVFEDLILSFTNLVLLFMVVSGFSLCCGYFHKIVNNQISVNEFYSKRYAKIWPFFALLCILDFVISPSENALYEMFANLTLCFGLLPNANISVIGVGWFLGLVFVFYLAFPFFCYLLSNKKRAWLSFVAALVFHYLCTVRFAAGRANIVYSAMFFFAGGMIFLYKETLQKIAEKYCWILLAGILALVAIYYMVSSGGYVMLMLFSAMLIYALRDSEKACILSNFFTKFLSGISLEMYLSHMVIFRIIEKLGMTKLFASDLLSYIVTSVGTIVGTIVFSLVGQKLLAYIVKNKFFRRALHEKNQISASLVAGMLYCILCSEPNLLFI